MSVDIRNRPSGGAWVTVLSLLGLAGILLSCGCLGGSISRVVFGNRELSDLSREQTILVNRVQNLQRQVAQIRRTQEDKLIELRSRQQRAATLLEKTKKALPQSQEVVKLIQRDLEDKRAQKQKAMATLKEAKGRNEQTTLELQDKLRRLQDDNKEWSDRESKRVADVLTKKHNEILKLERELAAGKAK